MLHSIVKVLGFLFILGVVGANNGQPNMTDDDENEHSGDFRCEQSHLQNFESEDEALDEDDTDPGVLQDNLHKSAALFLLTLKERYQLTQAAMDFSIGQVQNMLQYAFTRGPMFGGECCRNRFIGLLPRD